MSSPRTMTSQGVCGESGGGGGKGGSVFGILVGSFLVQVASVALNPLNGLIFGEEGLSGAQDPFGVLDGAFGPCGRGDGTFTVDP